MTILVTFASKYGSTRCIAETIAAELETLGHETVFAEVTQVPPLDRFDAAVIGSGVYMGRWLPGARTFVEAHRTELSGMPVWLFSSGPLGDQPAATPADAGSIVTAIHAQGHETFAGSLDTRTLGFGERLITKVVQARCGDFRDWEAIRAWAVHISTSLKDRAAVPAGHLVRTPSGTASQHGGTP